MDTRLGIVACSGYLILDIVACSGYLILDGAVLLTMRACILGQQL